jgi:glycosyltransferase involved in cell wall biosynthesis
MRIAFIDLGDIDYHPLSTNERPLGGMQSALCYLAVALAHRGHEVSLLNNTSTPGNYGGVNCYSILQYDKNELLRLEIVVSISCCGLALRKLGLKCQLIFWSGHDSDQPVVQALNDPNERNIWNKVVLVSDWQKKRYLSRFKLNTATVSVLKNAISPAFEKPLTERQYFFQKIRPPVLVYSSTPFRGLDILIRAFPKIRSSIPGCTARIFSSLSVYTNPGVKDPYENLYIECKKIKGVEYLGSVDQISLSEYLRDADILAFPSTFMETSCISLMEAMASGLLIVANDLGALKETANDFGHFCKLELQKSPDEIASAYADFVISVILDSMNNPINYHKKIESQITYTRENYNWSGRALEWESLLENTKLDLPRLRLPSRNESCICGASKKFKDCCGVLN